jgi:hypothetical protein
MCGSAARGCGGSAERAAVLHPRPPLYMDLGKALADPSSQQAAGMAAAGLPPFLARRALDALRDPAARDALAQKLLARRLVRRCAIARHIPAACDMCGSTDSSPPPPDRGRFRGVPQKRSVPAPAARRPSSVSLDRMYNQHGLVHAIAETLVQCESECSHPILFGSRCVLSCQQRVSRLRSCPSPLAGRQRPGPTVPPTKADS